MNTKTTTKEVRVIDTDKFEIGRAYRIRKKGEFATHDVICANVTERVVSFVLYNGIILIFINFERTLFGNFFIVCESFKVYLLKYIFVASHFSLISFKLLICLQISLLLASLV